MSGAGRRPEAADMPATGRIKICGLKRPEDIAFANACRPDYVGFVFAGKKRRVSLEQASALRQSLSSGITAVGVFVNEALSVIQEAAERGIIDMVQLHGQESREEILAVKALTGLPVIRAVSVKSAEEILEAQEFPCDYLLLDNGAGGTGERFSWEEIRKAQEQGFCRPFFLAGGISPANIEKARHCGAFCIDVSSGAETDGAKDFEKMKALTQAVRKE